MVTNQSYKTSSPALTNSLTPDQLTELQISACMGDPQKQETQRILTLIESLKEVSKNLENNSILFTNRIDSTTAIEVLSELQTKASTIFSTDPILYELYRLICDLKNLLLELENCQGYGLKSFLRRQTINYKVSQVAYAIETKIQAYTDRTRIEDLVKTLVELDNEDEKLKALIEFEKRLSRGFDLDFQELILKRRVFTILEFILCESICAKRVKEQAAVAIGALVKFNRNVFVGLVLMGPIIGALTSMASRCSIEVLSSLIRLIRTPLVDEIEANGHIPRIISLLCSEDLAIQVAALDCILELAFIGRKEVIEAMLREDLIEKLMEMQRMELQSNLIEPETGQYDNDTVSVGTSSQRKVEIKNKGEMGDFPFASCVSRFAIQLEVGEGLIPKERRELKLEILRLVRVASVSDAEVATISAEILWGSSPWN
ncbi:Armadillo-like helical [Quillaja saponaria]|uniref:Armadillo-like helical n=1 Tax=Quillaja saponaria TaxID=32244 RepID=A0AAD7LIH8_QUISA|nr:Armadillo-like helical [Quillaja saponaria]